MEFISKKDKRTRAEIVLFSPTSYSPSWIDHHHIIAKRSHNMKELLNKEMFAKPGGREGDARMVPETRLPWFVAERWMNQEARRLERTATRWWMSIYVGEGEFGDACACPGFMDWGRLK
jgi:hypothetical protein